MAKPEMTKSPLQLIQEVRAELARAASGERFTYIPGQQIAKLAEAERGVAAMRAAVEEVERELRNGDVRLWAADALRKALDA